MTSTDNRTTTLLQELRDLAVDVNSSEIVDHVSITRLGWTFDARWLDSWHTEYDRIVDELGQAIAATLGKPMGKDLRWALGSMRIWISDDAHLGESELSYEFEKAEGLRKLEAIEQAIAATIRSGTLTAEQVREAVESNSWAETCSIREFNDSSWQGIADELNTRAERTCKKQPPLIDQTCIVRRNCQGSVFEMEFGYWRCSECECENFDGARFCMGCGAKVVE